MDLADDIFGELVDKEKGSSQLFEVLEKHLPDGSFQVVSNNGKPISSGKELRLSGEVCDSLADKAKKENCLIHHELPDGLVIHAMPTGELNEALIFCLPKQDSESVLRPYGTVAVQLCVDLFISQKPFMKSKRP